MTGNNASGLTSVAGILVVWATLIFAVRIWVKTRLRAVDFWGPDDTFVSLAFVRPFPWPPLNGVALSTY